MKTIGLIGCGYWGKNLVRDLYSLGVLKLVCDSNKKNLDYIKNTFPNLSTTASWEEMLADTSIKSVFISLPAELHYIFAKQAILCGKDVFVEKPLSLNLNEAEELESLAKTHLKILMVGHLLQYHPAIKKINDIVLNDKIIGDIRYIVSNRLNLGKIRNEENVLWSFSPHDISIILKLMGDKLPNNIVCHGKAFISKNIHDITSTFLDFGENCYAQINVNWLNPFKEQKLTIVGTKGMITFDDIAENKLLLFPEYIKWDEGVPTIIKDVAVNIVYNDSENPLINECLHFINCCNTRKQPLTNSEEGIRVLKVLQYAQKSLNQNSEKVIVNSDKNYFVHSSTDIENNAIIGKDTKIWRNSHIMNAVIGNNCNIGQNCFIANNVKIGNNCKIQNNVSVYEGVECEDDVFLGPSCVLTNDNNPRAAFSKNGKYLKTIIKKGVTIGANATILPGVTLNEYCLIGAGAVVTKDVEPYAVMVGNPAVKIRYITKEGLINKYL